MPRSLVVAAFVVGTAVVPAQADGDAVAGKTVFKKCAACHEAVVDRAKVGPPLVGIVGRSAGAYPGFKYSKDMIAAAEGGLVWDEENLERYLRKPKDLVPKGSMAFPGLPKDEDVENVIAYLKADPKPE